MRARKTWNDAIHSNEVATRDYQIKWNKSEGERQMPYDITYMWNLKYGTNEPIYRIENKLTNVENRLVVADREGVGIGGS